jgi:hypothetical protein
VRTAGSTVLTSVGTGVEPPAGVVPGVLDDASVVRVDVAGAGVRVAVDVGTGVFVDEGFSGVPVGVGVAVSTGVPVGVADAVSTVSVIDGVPVAGVRVPAALVGVNGVAVPSRAQKRLGDFSLLSVVSTRMVLMPSRRPLVSSGP